MAGAGYKLFNTGDVLTAAQVNTYLQEQAVMRFANAAARTTALSGVLAEGMMSYLDDTNAVEVYNGSAWVSISADQTPLTTKGDLFTYSTTDARLGVGSNGETLVADSSTTTGLRWQGNFAAGKNKIINGDFGIWQRGTTFTTIADNTYFADRWRSNGANNSYSRQTFTPGTAPVAGYEGEFFARGTVTGSGSTQIGMGYKIEDVRTFAGQTATLSFWAKADSARTLTLYASQEFGVGGSAGVGFDGSKTWTLSTSWTRYTVTLSVPSISGKTIGTSNFVNLIFYLAPGQASGSVTLDIWGVQFEAGSVATPFTTATGTLAGELAACQRYYWRQSGETYNAYGSGISTSATAAGIYVAFPVPMRTKPSAVEFSTLEISDLNAYSLAVTACTLTTNEFGTQMARLSITNNTGATANRPAFLRNANNTAGYLGFTAEL